MTIQTLVYHDDMTTRTTLRSTGQEATPLEHYV